MAEKWQSTGSAGNGGSHPHATISDGATAEDRVSGLLISRLGLSKGVDHVNEVRSRTACLKGKLYASRLHSRYCPLVSDGSILSSSSPSCGLL